MRKIFAVSLLLCLGASSGFAFQSGSLPLGVGAKYAAMGGAGAAIVDDITSAYYNPAGIVKSGNLELKIGAGSATEGLNELISTLGSASDPAKLLSSNFGKSLSVNGGLNSIVGLNLAKLGISVIPVASLALTKAANTINSTISGMVAYEGILTMGYSFSIPGLPIAGLDLGANVKSVTSINATSATTTSGTGFTSTDTVNTYTGMGFDIGAKASVDTLVVPLSVAIVMKDISETLKGKSSVRTSTYDATGAITTQTSPVEATLADTTNPTTLVIGAATRIPGYGILVAADLDSVSGGGVSYSVTHIGVEYPVFGLLSLRAGTVSGGPGGSISQTTLGAGFNLGANINVAMMTDAKNSKNNSTLVDFGFAF